jgi:hypothetical protein
VTVIVLIFTEVIILLVVEMNQQYYHYFNAVNDGPFPFSNVAQSEKFIFLSLIIQLAH